MTPYHNVTENRQFEKCVRSREEFISCTLDRPPFTLATIAPTAQDVLIKIHSHVDITTIAPTAQDALIKIHSHVERCHVIQPTPLPEYNITTFNRLLILLVVHIPGHAYTQSNLIFTHKKQAYTCRHTYITLLYHIPELYAHSIVTKINMYTNK